VVDAGGVRKKDPSPEFVAEAMFAMPVGIERLFHDMKNQIDADARMKGRVGIALTEYLFRAPIFRPRLPITRRPASRVPNLGGAIWLAGMLNTLIRVADFVRLPT